MKVTCYTFKGLFIALVLAMFSGVVAAQRISGTVLDADTDEALVGASISVQNAGRGAVSDASGKFSIDARSGDQVSVSYVGYETLLLTIGAETQLSIRLKPQNQLNEVTVTALGISREKKSLG